MNYFISSSQPCGVVGGGALLSPLYMRKMRLREVKRLVQSLTAKEPWNKDWHSSRSPSLQETDFSETLPLKLF